MKKITSHMIQSYKMQQLKIYQHNARVLCALTAKKCRGRNKGNFEGKKIWNTELPAASMLAHGIRMSLRLLCFHSLLLCTFRCEGVYEYALTMHLCLDNIQSAV